MTAHVGPDDPALLDVLAAAFSAAPVALAVVDDSGAVIACNRMFSAEIGFAQTSARQQMHFDAICGPGSWVVLTTAARRGPSNEVAVDVRRDDGSSAAAVATLTRLETTPGGAWLVNLRTDAAGARDHENAQGEAVGQLAAGVAHDFNNLLMVIMGHIDAALEEPQLPPTVRSSLEHALAGTERGAQLVDNLLSYSRRQILRTEPVPLNELVSGDVSLYAQVLGDDVELVLRLDPRAGVANIDRARVSQVLLNLVVNARDAMPNGGRLTLRTTREANAAGVDGTAIAVIDTGEGMTPDVLSRVFDPFFTTKPHGRGTGLGLSTAYGVVRQLGGAITVRSRPGEGSTFQVWLPEAADPRAEAGDGPTDDAAGGVDDAPAGVALVADDDREVRRFVSSTLRRRGYQVHEANDGAHALTVAAAIKGPITLVVTDIRMPHVGGVELADELQRRFPETPALLITGYADMGSRPAGPTVPTPVLLMTGYADLTPSRGPARGLLRKPFTAADLLEAVDALHRSGRGRVGLRR